MKRTPSLTFGTMLFMSLGLLLASLGAARVAPAVQQGGGNFGLEGKITRESPGKLTVNSQDNIIFHVTYDEQTKITRKDGSAGSAADLAVGSQIRVDGSLNAEGVLKARSIHIE